MIVFDDIIKADVHGANFNVRDELKSHTVDELVSITRSNLSPFSIAMMNVTGDLNIGTMIRTAHLFGSEKIFIFGRNRFDRRSLVGADNYSNIEYCGGLNSDLTIDESRFKNVLDDNGYFPVIMETNGEDLTGINWQDHITGNKKPCFVVGNEGRGIDFNIINSLSSFEKSLLIKIPQKGVMRSFNVGNALSIVLWDASKAMKW